jgi:hypothetical protein
MSLLTTIQRCCRHLGIPVPSAVISNTDAQVQQLQELSQLAGEEIAAGHEWTALKVVRTFTGTAAQEQPEPPAINIAFKRYAPVAHLWDVNMRRPLVGPLTDDQWMDLITNTTTGVDKYWTILDGKINIYPIPDVADSFRFTYLTKNWIRIMGGDRTTDIAEWAHDDDTALIPERLVYLSTVWRFKQAKGLDYGEDMSSFGRALEQEAARDGGPRIIPLSRRRTDPMLDTIWPGAIGTP